MLLVLLSAIDLLEKSEPKLNLFCLSGKSLEIRSIHLILTIKWNGTGNRFTNSPNKIEFNKLLY